MVLSHACQMLRELIITPRLEIFHPKLSVNKTIHQIVENKAGREEGRGKGNGRG